MIVPLVDHHQHLLSLNAQQALSPLAQPEVKLPAPLAALLQKRADHWSMTLQQPFASLASRVGGRV
jgi:hypothetical protein